MALAYLHVPNTIETILDSRIVTPDQVRDLRRTVWSDGIVGRREAELFFEIEDTLETGCGEWNDLFAEALVAHLVGQATPRGSVSEEDASWFRGRVLRDGRMRGAVELETLVQVIERAAPAPASLVVLALDAVHAAVMEGDGDMLGHAALVPGVLGDPEVALLRRVLYAKGSGRPDGVRRGEAERVMALDEATAGADNAASWSTLFVTVMSNHLLVHSGHDAPPRERLGQIDRWLNQPTDGLAGFGRRVARRLPGIGTTVQALEIFGTERPMAAIYRPSPEGRGAGRADAGDAQWLVERIDRDGALGMNEAALLHFLRASGLETGGGLAPLMARI